MKKSGRLNQKDWEKVRCACDGFKDRYSTLLEAIRTAHKRKPNGGHDLGHDLTVAHFAVAITPDNKPHLLEVVFLAGILHSADRFANNQPGKFVREVLKHHSSKTKKEIRKIVHAVKRHAEENDESKLILRILQDADRLASLMLSVTFRAGAFYHTTQPVELREKCDWFKDPRGSYGSPPTIFRDVANCLDWDPDKGDDRFRITMPKAIPVARILVQRLREFLEETLGQYKKFKII